jgi:hypothetical protein
MSVAEKTSEIRIDLGFVLAFMRHGLVGDDLVGFRD